MEKQKQLQIAIRVLTVQEECKINLQFNHFHNAHLDYQHCNHTECYYGCEIALMTFCQLT